MNTQDAWEKALRETEIIRNRVQSLLTFRDTLVPYILLCPSSINPGDTVVRRGEILVEKPALILPPNISQFEGFDFGESEDQNSLMNFFLIRGVTLPSLKYNNKTVSLDIHEGKIQGAIDSYMDQLQRKEDVETGLIRGTEEFWQFSLLIFICSQITKNANQDIQRLMDDFKERQSS